MPAAPHACNARAIASFKLQNSGSGPSIPVPYFPLLKVNSSPSFRRMVAAERANLRKMYFNYCRQKSEIRWSMEPWKLLTCPSSFTTSMPHVSWWNESWALVSTLNALRGWLMLLRIVRAGIEFPVKASITRSDACYNNEDNNLASCKRPHWTRAYLVV